MPTRNDDARRAGFNPGPHAKTIEAFRSELHELGYAAGTIENYSHSARHLVAWADAQGVDLVDITPEVFDRFRHHRCSCPGGQKRSVSRLSSGQAWRFLCHATGRDPRPSGSAREAPSHPLIAGFGRWQLDHRGLSPHTVASNCRLIRRWLARLGPDPAGYDPVVLREAVLAEAAVISASALTRSLSALRAYLRYLTFRRLCPESLLAAVPSVAQWRLSTLPRYLPAERIEAVIASCDVASATGLRDRAILLLLARLALRAGDIVQMRLDDLRWEQGKVQVLGKGRRRTLLPLSQEVGDALLAYIEHGRPTVAFEQVFLRAIAPYRPFHDASAISVIVRRALRRAGITDAPTNGAHLLRHSAATSLLRSGSTLETIGAVLRHTSMDSTAIYAKVDVPMLSAIAQPWPGASEC